MTKLRPAQQLPPAKKITRETLAANPLLAMLVRQRAKEISLLKKAAKAAPKSSFEEQLELDPAIDRGVDPEAPAEKFDNDG